MPRLRQLIRMRGLVSRFGRDRGGNFGALTALLMLPMILAVGFAIDGSRYYKARTHLQEVVDTAALAVAASSEQDKEKLREEAERFIIANLAMNTVENVRLGAFDADAEEITIGSQGSIRTTFMRLANVETMPVAASTLAMRAPDNAVEVALVLDNTYSMIEKDPKSGASRIDTLKVAAHSLVETLVDEDGEGPVKVALVPYADHVNVGVANKNASWLQLNGEERSETTGEGNYSCTKTTETVPEYCSKWVTEPATCSRVRDGVTETYPCTSNTSTCRTTSTTKTTETCSGTPKKTTTYKFFGCVGTRVSNTLRLSDDSPTVRYPGYVETIQYCAQPIIPLTKDRAALLAGVASMTHQPVKDYYPNTHIPSGLVWGLNALSPTMPLTEAADYDVERRAPRKVLILMTDGDNTLRVNAKTGKHYGFGGTDADKASQTRVVNDDTRALCRNAKAKGIEIYSVAFMVTKAEPKAILLECASDEAHYFDATDAARLTEAFSGIARSISQVRLAR